MSVKLWSKLTSAWWAIGGIFFGGTIVIGSVERLINLVKRSSDSDDDESEVEDED